MKNATNVAPILFSLAAGQHVVQTAESDVIAPAVAAEDPLALLDEAVTEFEELLADVAAALLHQRDELVGNLLGLEGAFAVGDPLGEEGLDFGASAVAGQNVHRKFCSFLHNALHAVAHLAVNSPLRYRNGHWQFLHSRRAERPPEVLLIPHDALHAVAHLATTICSNLSVGQNISLLLC